MKIIIAGSTGLVGEEVVAYFQKRGHDVARLVRASSKKQVKGIVWDIEKKEIDHKALEGADAVIHLGGAGIAEHRWTADYQELILESRVSSTSFLSKTLARLKEKPKVFLCASAVGYYGSQAADITCDEASPAGQGFLAHVCQKWEASTELAMQAGIRTCSMRMGVVLSKKGGALKQMWIPFQLGLGGILGSGKQMYSWIALKEIPAMMDFLIQSEVSGPVNMTTPQPVTNYDFTKALGRAIHRPTVLPVPAFGARLLFGEMADALLLEGAKAMPEKLLKAGYTFNYPDIDAGFQAAI